MLMVLLDLFPAGVLQFEAVVDRGLWYARSSEFIDSDKFQTLTWMRIIGGTIFTLGGVVPLTYLVVTVSANLKHKTLRNTVNNPNEKVMA
jgi:nitric oxide reductase subunit B